MAALLDRFLPIGISNLLRQSTRFSHSFHVGGSSKKGQGDSSISTAKFRSRIATRTEESKNTYTSGSETTGFFGYQKNTDVSREETIPTKEDPCNFEEEKWVSEKTLDQKHQNLKTFDNEKKHMDHLRENHPPQEQPRRDTFQDETMQKIAEIDNKKRALSEITIQPKKNLNSIISKAPFAVANAESLRASEAEKYERSSSSHNSKQGDDRVSVDVWRASQPAEQVREEPTQQDPEQKDQILDQWLGKNRQTNGTIAEDISAEDEEDSSRMSRSTAGANDFKTVVAKPKMPEAPQHSNEEEEENELHKIHMLQSLQALQYMKKVSLPHEEELRDKFVYLPPPKHKNCTKTLIFDMDETLIH